MWDLIINPITTLMTLLYSVFGNNIVLAIVVLTILTRLATYPLTMQQQRSTKAMQEIQPELKKIQEKYKNDREKLSQAQMELYKKHGVNPFGGCLPMFIQLPILLALYQAIIQSLADTPFRLIDLSDRLLIPGLGDLLPLKNTWLGMNLSLAPGQNPPIALALPLLVLITTWIQTKMTMPSTPPAETEDGKPAPGQGMTQSMGTIMPLMFGFFALQFAVGLSVYFIVSNLVGIVQYGAMGKADIRNLIPGRAKSASEPALDGKSGKAQKQIAAKSKSSSKKAAKTK
jgi:YidC/Oxa1 family membrane protein insertase